MPNTTFPGQFPFWGRPSPIYIGGQLQRQTHPFAELMAGVGQGMAAYAKAKKEKAGEERQEELLQLEKRKVDIAEDELSQPDIQIVHGGENVWAIDKKTLWSAKLEGIKPKSSSKSSLGKLLDERSQHKPGSPEYKAYDDAIKKATTHPPSTTIQFGAEKTFQNKKAAQRAFVEGPDFMDKVMTAVTKQTEDYHYLDRKQQQSLIWEESNKRIKSVFPSAKFMKDDDTGIQGWYDENGRLIRLWLE